MVSLTSFFPRVALFTQRPVARLGVSRAARGRRAKATTATGQPNDHSAGLSLATLSPAEREWFHVFKWERPASPATMQHLMAQTFGARHAEELVVFFEKTAIPARPGEWRRRMH
jgi:hypothetical protein